MENHIVPLNEYNLDHWQFYKEMIALMQTAQGSTKTRPVIVSLQIGNTRWVLNSETCGNLASIK